VREGEGSIRVHLRRIENQRRVHRRAFIHEGYDLGSVGSTHLTQQLLQLQSRRSARRRRRLRVLMRGRQACGGLCGQAFELINLGDRE